jgi:hypothetical protein
MRAKPSCEHHIGLLGEQKPDRFPDPFAPFGAVRPIRLAGAVLAETMMTATARLDQVMTWPTVKTATPPTTVASVARKDHVEISQVGQEFQRGRLTDRA